jgi:xanthine phosphoribosyltransferase
MPKKYYAYTEFQSDLKVLTQKIDISFDAIVAIARGGLSMAQMLGEYYGIREVYTINAIGYDDRKKRERLNVFNIPDLSRVHRVLIVDDIVDTGDTLSEVLNVLENAYVEIEFMTASLFYKRTAVIAPDFWVQEATEWIEFFWSEDLKSKSDII